MADFGPRPAEFLDDDTFGGGDVDHWIIGFENDIGVLRRSGDRLEVGRQQADDHLSDVEVVERGHHVSCGFPSMPFIGITSETWCAGLASGGDSAVRIRAARYRQGQRRLLNLDADPADFASVVEQRGAAEQAII